MYAKYYDLNLKEGGVIVTRSQNPFVSDLAILGIKRSRFFINNRVLGPAPSL